MNASIHFIDQRAASKRRSAGFRMALPLLLCALLLVSGCTSGSTMRPHVGAISFTDATGNALPAITALTAGQGAYMEVAITNDASLLFDLDSTLVYDPRPEQRASWAGVR